MSMKTNPYNIALLPEDLRTQLFAGDTGASKMEARINLELMGDYRNKVVENTPYILEHTPDLPFKIGDKDTINEVIEGLATERVSFVHEAVDSIIRAKLTFMPYNQVVIQGGWTKYTPTSNPNLWDVTPVSAPNEDGVFDTETFVKMNQCPVIAVYRSATARYLWLHPGLADPSLPFDPRIRIPLGTAKVVVGWNVSFDRQTTSPKEDHPSGPWWTRRCWLDGMSMHTVCNGLADEQRKEWVRQSKNPYAKWFEEGSPKSLVEAWNFHVGKPFGRQLMSEDDKTIREIFVEAQSIQQIHSSIHKLIQYCFLDVDHTWELLREVWPKYLYASPSNIALASTIIMGQQCLPLSPDWQNWIRETEGQYQALCKDIKDGLTALAREKCEEFVSTGVRPDGPWMAQLDWTPAKTGKAKGYPAWWRKMKVDKEGVTPTGILAPLFLEVTFQDKPVFYHKVHKWGVLGEHGFGRVEKVEDLQMTTIPHPKNGPKKNCGGVFSKDYSDLWDDGVFNGTDPDIVGRLKVISYWRSVRERVMHEPAYMGPEGNLFVRPATIVNGAGTGRATEKLYLTMCGTKKNKLGSELKAMIRSHPGRRLVSFDYVA